MRKADFTEREKEFAIVEGPKEAKRANMYLENGDHTLDGKGHRLRKKRGICYSKRRSCRC